MEGIEPDELNYRTGKILYAGYPLRPEIVESAYYLHRLTGDPEYLAMGAAIFRDFIKYCRTDDAYAALADVRTKEKADDMESFALAETFKYFYLLFSPPDALDFDGVVFNTEAHPLRRAH